MSDAPSTQSAVFTRREIVSMVRALEEYEVECVPPRRDLCERVEALLRAPGEKFWLMSDEKLDAIHSEGFRQGMGGE